MTAGETARNTVKSAGNAVGLAEQAAAKTQVVASDADQAASGAYSSAAQIPYIGWLIAPAAAVTAAAAVMAYAEGGQLRVGAALQPTMLHKDEMVWPGWAAHGARNMLASFSAGDFNVPRGGDTYHAFAIGRDDASVELCADDPRRAGAQRDGRAAQQCGGVHVLHPRPLARRRDAVWVEKS